MNRYILPLIVVVIFIPILYLGLNNDPRHLPSQFIDKPAPVFDLPTLKDPSSRLTNENLKGQVSIVNIWATWCAGCRAEHQFLVQLAKSGSTPIYGINWRDKKKDATQWLKELGDPYVASGFDTDGRIGIEWGVYGAPETFLVNAEGTVIYRFTGPLSWPLWQQEFEPRIAEIMTQ